MVKNSIVRAWRVNCCEKEQGPTRSGPVREGCGRSGWRRPLHLAAGRRARHVVRILGDRSERHAGVLGAVRVLGAGLFPDRGVERLLQLVVALAHLDVTAELALPLHALHGCLLYTSPSPR